MRRFLCILLAVLCLSLCACGKKKAPEPEPLPAPVQTAAPLPDQTQDQAQPTPRPASSFPRSSYRPVEISLDGETGPMHVLTLDGEEQELVLSGEDGQGREFTASLMNGDEWPEEETEAQVPGQALQLRAEETGIPASGQAGSTGPFSSEFLLR